MTNLKFTDTCKDYYNGQYAYKLDAFNEQSVNCGYIDYGDYRGKPYINFIFVNEGFKRQGIATKLLQELQKNILI